MELPVEPVLVATLPLAALASAAVTALEISSISPSAFIFDFPPTVICESLTATATERATGSLPVVAVVLMPTVDSVLTFRCDPDVIFASLISTAASVTVTMNASGTNSFASISLDTSKRTLAAAEIMVEALETISPARPMKAVPTFTLKQFRLSDTGPRRSMMFLV